MERRRNLSTSGMEESSRSELQQLAGHILNKAASKISDRSTQDMLQEIRQVITNDEFYNSLTHILPKPKHGSTPPPKRLRDSEFNKIAELCRLFGKPKWACRPRHFVVLYMIGHLNLMDEIVADNRSDVSLPYSEGNMPDALNGNARNLFLKYQQNVLTGQGMILEQPRNPHQYIEGSSDDLFWYLGALGRGGSGEVDLVVGKVSLKQFARKRIPRGELAIRDKRGISMFENEIRILKNLSHRHIVSLIGSYTDRDYVGFVMSPVADKNLATFLSEDVDENMRRHRQTRLRCLFGCIASAIEYLHRNKVRHKDIKPSNIVVKGDKVFITDFGTSHYWIDNSSDTTNGTLNNFTLLYLAPESESGKHRNTAGDIWSLGCVFLEMCTVLAGFSLKDLQSFLKNNGSNSRFYWANCEVLVAWISILTKSFNDADSPRDAQLLDIIRYMCIKDPGRRLDAQSVVTRIFSLKTGSPFYGPCCSPKNSAMNELPDRNVFQETEPTIPLLEEGELLPWIGYVQPSVEDADSTIGPFKNYPPKSDAVLEDITITANHSTQNPHTDALTLTQSNGVVDHNADHREINMVHTNRTQGTIARDINSRVIQDSRSATQKKSSSSKHYSRPVLDPHALPCPWPGCKPAPGLALVLFDSISSLRAHLRADHLCHDFGWSRLFEDETENSCREKLVSETPDCGPLVLSKTVTHPRKRSSKNESVRFADPPEGQNLQRIKQRVQPSPGSDTYRVNAERLELPIWIKDKDGLDQEIPPSSFVPSYVLAARNRFTRSELLSLKHTRPLFVYGTMMFPSVLQSIAQSFVSSEGTYSSEKLRRLRTGPIDWNNVDTSITRAAACMTPALIKGYQRLTDRHHSLAYLCPLENESQSEVRGFLVFGLSAEALACIEHLYERNGPGEYFTNHRSPVHKILLKTDDNDENEGVHHEKWWETQLKREDVNVQISLVGQEDVNVNAITFVRDDRWRESQKMSFIDWQTWSINDFVRSPTFHRLTALKRDMGVWMQQEEEIAQTIGTQFVLVGDHLVQRVMENDERGLQKLLRDYSVDSPSAKFGTALQAAAAQGNEDMTDLLLDAGASVNLSGGEYGSALIAAVVAQSRPVVSELLHEQANLFVPGGRWVSAIYQAVDFDNIEIAHLLLEKGAWLTTDYDELLDLAAERNNPEMRRELERYDVRDLHRWRKIKDKNHHGTDEQEIEHYDGEPVEDVSISVLATKCLLKAAQLKGQRGKWSGIKGVEVLRIAFENGMDPKLLEYIRPHIHSFPTLQRFFVQAIGDRLGGAFKPIKHTDIEKEEKRRGALRQEQGRDNFVRPREAFERWISQRDIEKGLEDRRRK